MIEDIFSRYPKKPESLVMILQDIQGAMGYLSEAALERVAEELNLPLAKVYSVASFYRVLKFKPTGKHNVKVCMGTACHVKGAPLILNSVLSKLKIKDGETTDDRKFTVQSVGCIGACAIGPVVEVNEECCGNMTVIKANKLLTRIDKNEKKS